MKNLKVLFAIAMVVVMMASCAPAATEAPAAEVPATEAPAAVVATEAPAAEVATEAPAAEVPAATDAEAVCAADAKGCAKIEPGQTIKIGMGAPLTGGDASFGIDISQGASIAITDAGEFEGFKFELIAEDDGGTAEGGAAVANKFVSDQTIVAVAGHIFSGATASAMPIYEEKGIPMLSPSATNPALTTKGSTVFNRVVFTDAQQGKFAAEYLFNKLGVKNLAIVHDGQDYGKGLGEIVKTNFEGLGGTVVAFEAITPKEADYTPVLATIAAKAPEAVYFGGYTQDASTLQNGMKQTGLESTIFFGCDGSYGADFITRTAENGEGAYAVSLTPPASAEKQTFDAAYEAAFGKKPGELSPYTWNGYDAAAALAATVKAVAIKGADGNLYIPRAALVAAVRGMKDYAGISGTFTCDAVGECNASGPLFVIVKDGVWVPAE